MPGTFAAFLLFIYLSGTGISLLIQVRIIHTVGRKKLESKSKKQTKTKQTKNK